MAAFFALNISAFPKSDDGSTEWSLVFLSELLCMYIHGSELHLLTSYSVGISLAVSIPFILFAFNVNFLAEALNGMTHSLVKALVKVLQPFCSESEETSRTRKVPRFLSDWYERLLHHTLKRDLPLERDDHAELHSPRKVKDKPLSDWLPGEKSGWPASDEDTSDEENLVLINSQRAMTQEGGFARVSRE